MADKIYKGLRMADLIVTINGKKLKHIECHSPDGFEWGYGGSGPADLALSILADFTGSKELAYKYHQAFKWEFIANLAKEQWKIEGKHIQEWLDIKGAEC